MVFALITNLPCSSNGKESACSAGDQGSIPGLARSSGEGNDNPLQYSCLENPMDRRAHGGLQSVGSQRVRHDWATDIHLLISPFGVACSGLPWQLSGKESTCQAGDVGLISESGRSPGGGHSDPLQYSCLENPMDGGDQQATAQRVTELDVTE